MIYTSTTSTNLSTKKDIQKPCVLSISTQPINAHNSTVSTMYALLSALKPS